MMVSLDDVGAARVARVYAVVTLRWVLVGSQKR